MAKNKSKPVPPSTPEAFSAAETDAGPVPANRAVTPNMVKVRARQPFCEIIEGESYYVGAGQIATLPEDRIAALGELVAPLGEPTAA